jgi:hypothetical protein
MVATAAGFHFLFSLLINCFKNHVLIWSFLEVAYAFVMIYGKQRPALSVVMMEFYLLTLDGSIMIGSEKKDRSRIISHNVLLKPEFKIKA